MLAYFFPRLAVAWASLRLTLLLVLFVGCLVAQHSCQPQPGRPGIRAVLPAAQAAGLPAGLYYRPAAHLWVRLPHLRDSSRHRAGNLQRKMLPPSRWAVASGYLVGPRPRRPRQGVLDSLAAAARHAK